ncbi:hypothetical protein [Williamsia serinedens]|uniref:Mce-associated membrane protein n=1 Tax=Williamsia serinedens TaxID=391736 RepID=A0ABT1H2H2_9NOCA|nr:hypothetical protein [Williamsia serinedens]MCP2161428.1 hypothetical protein [Williamsia serinedens]
MSADASTGAGKDSRRLVVARERVVAARAAVDAATERLEATRAHPSRDGHRIAVAATGIGVTVAIGAAIASPILHAQSASGPSDDVVRAASTAVATVLTADPAHPDRYLAAARAVSGGEYRRRVDAAGPAIESAVASLGAAGTGQVVAAGVVGGPVSSSGPADVLVVAETTAPQLVGGNVGDRRIVLSVSMIREAGSWVIGQVALR